MTGYLFLLAIFAVLLFLIFVPALIELRRPRDAGPLKIDLDAPLNDRYFSLSLEHLVWGEPVGDGPAEKTGDDSEHAPVVWSKAVGAQAPKWLTQAKGEVGEVVMNRGTETVWRVAADVRIPDGSRVPNILVAKGSLTAGEGCDFSQDVFVGGDCNIGPRSRLRALGVKGDLSIAQQCEIAEWIDAQGDLTLSDHCTVGTRVTAGKNLIVGTACKLKTMAAPDFSVSVSADPAKQATSETTASCEGASDKDSAVAVDGGSPIPEEQGADRLDHIAELDEIIRTEFHQRPIEDIVDIATRCLGGDISAPLIMRRARTLGLIEKPLERISDQQKPAYLRSKIVWRQGHETFRVTGDVRIPTGTRVMYNMIIDGSLVVEDDVMFEGGVHVRGDCQVGKRCIVAASIVAIGRVEVSEDAKIDGVIDADGDVFLHRGVRIGYGKFGGGVGSGSLVILEQGVFGCHKIIGVEGILTVSDGGEPHAAPPASQPTVSQS